MNKGNTFWGIIWILIAVFLTGILLKGLGKDGFESLFERNSSLPELNFGRKINDDDFYRSGKMRLEDISNENVLNPEKLEEIEVISHSAKLIMELSKDDYIHVNFTGKWDKKKLPIIDCENGKLLVKSQRINGFIFHPFMGGKKEIVIFIPKDCLSDETQINLTSASGSIRIKDLIANTINTNAASGSLHITDCFAERLNLEAASGSLHVEGGKYDFIQSEVASGSTNINSSFNKIRLEGASGSMKIQTSTPITQDSSIEVVSGSITMKLPRNSDYTIDFETMSGSFKDELAGFSGSRNGHYSKGSGSPKIKISSVSGSIRITE